MEYSSSDEVDTAINSLNGTQILGRKISLEKYKGKGMFSGDPSEDQRIPSSSGQSNKVFIKTSNGLLMKLGSEKLLALLAE